MDFTTPFLLDLLSHHTGLNNVLPLFLFPSMYAANTLSVHTGKMPLLHHLLKSTVSSFVDVAVIPLKWVVSDLLHVSTGNRNRLSLRSKGKISKAPALQRISDDLGKKRLAWHLTIKSKVTSPLSVTPDLLPVSWNSSAGVSHHYATLWLPKLPGWAIDTGRPKKFPVSTVPLGVLRRSWQSPPLPRRPWPHPPPVPIRSYLLFLRAFNWKVLWSLDLAGKDLQR
ncbi:hypothetical protein HMPREF1544_11861 [Mucor circinelloides 1006PhL]|uniref:Uncharacterized protein n=1 Tax=Mucor circinelloides f. circinelloides (strain 1006PhL) TaxID=1220926 RepID=S2IUX0_MUCC1|nr:hypothetical protein HMPREF1544_11861 [Mucor circinelloides 1006PhL]